MVTRARRGQRRRRHGRRSRTAALTALLIAAAAYAQPEAQPDQRALSEQPYLGLSVRDTPDGLVVGWIRPGPLGGASFTSESGIRRGDNVVTLNGEPVDAASFSDTLGAMSPGDEITLVLRRSPDAGPNAAVPKGGDGGEPYEVVVTLASRDEWTGTIGRGWPHGEIPSSPQGAHERRVLELAQTHGIFEHETGLRKLMAHLEGVQEDAMDPNAMTHVVRAFRSPLSLDAIANELGALIEPIRRDRSRRTADRLRTIRDQTRRALIREHDPNKNGEILDTASVRSLLRTMRDGWTIDPAHARAQIGVIRAASRTAPAQIERAFGSLIALAETLEPFDGSELMPASLPQGSVQGETAAAYHDTLGRLIVLGGAGDNVYDMSFVDVVVDPSGDDEYVWPETLTDTLRHQDQLIIDLDGHDGYISSAHFAGPGAGVHAGSIIDDHAGNDVYESTTLASLATGVFGIGVIIDRAGDDQYINTGADTGWSIGAGFYGFGLVVDQSGDDIYLGEKLTQGVGGPRGIGAVLDARGDDMFIANGPNFTSAYGTPGVFLGMSQGFGFGVRGYAAGGIGVIDDAQGNDTYQAGEFSQGGGYFFGLGLLRDRSGHDIYDGNRYGQAFAAHQAVGILIDDSGDDRYISMTAASQSGVWDESITLLWDKQGNDSYTCEGLGIGAAAMQSIALFVDSLGDDVYAPNPGGDVLGQSSRDTYHFAAARVHSFSCFMDLGSGDDVYPEGLRSNSSDVPTGTPNEADPQNATLHGVFLDE